MIEQMRNSQSLLPSCSTPSFAESRENLKVVESTIASLFRMKVCQVEFVRHQPNKLLSANSGVLVVSSEHTQVLLRL